MAKQEEKKKVKVKVKQTSAKKRDLQSERKRLANRSYRSSFRTAVKRFHDAMEEKNKEAIQSELEAVYSVMDKGVKRGVFKLNKASRTKSRLALQAASAK